MDKHDLRHEFLRYSEPGNPGSNSSEIEQQHLNPRHSNSVPCLGKTGEVVGFAPNGAISVKFNAITYRFNPQSLLKVPQLNSGDVVRIRSDPEEMKVLNQRIGWKSEMTTALGKVGRVTRVDEDGDVVVAFGQHSFVFTPACCEPDLNASLDSLQGYTSSEAASSSKSSDESDSNDDYGVLHQEMMKLAARTLADVLGRGGLQRGGQEGRRPSSEGSDKGIDGLLRAVIKGDKDIVKSICQSNRSLLNFVHKGMTPLMVACHEGQQEVAKALLELGAEINRVENGSTALMAALEGKKEKMALFLLEKGADPHLRNNKKRNAIHLAAYHNMPEAIKALVLKGADVNAKDQYGDTPLVDAIEQESNEAIDMLGKANVNIVGDKRLTPLHLACIKAHYRSVEALLESGANVNLQDEDGDTALHITLGVRVQNPESLAGRENIKQRARIACVLLTKGAYVDITNKKGAMPLQCCPHEVLRQTVKQFIVENPNVIKQRGGGSGGTAAQRASPGLNFLLQGLNLPCGRCMRPADITLMPCGHKTLCRSCCLLITECPLCDAPIERRLAKRSDSVQRELEEACKQM
ncbi:hypothetical protein C0Q70_04107 [Pomacea canaliculata]|uniref:RING-type E3 ubiquitin transferase n=1 Tax=Pomacea canaliculata TaxID=400727 RepID=A0A2T7PUK6_POMCA|nr:hypothetical protein C0Q70_04107 [Pomacea canaliculata]